MGMCICVALLGCRHTEDSEVKDKRNNWRCRDKVINKACHRLGEQIHMLSH